MLSSRPLRNGTLEALPAAGLPQYEPTASAPCSSTIARNRAAISVTARSQGTSTYWSSTRFIGASTRRGCSTASAAVRPFAQKSCQVYGFRRSGTIFSTRLSATVTVTPQEARQ